MSEVSTGDRQQPAARLIRSREWAGWPGVIDYRQAELGDILVERLIWDGLDGPKDRDVCSHAPDIACRPGHIWFRFWLPDHQQVVERYFDPAGELLGMQVDVCGPLMAMQDGLVAADLLLDIWIAPDGRVTVCNEVVFEWAVQNGLLSAEQAAQAERHVRSLTGAIAAGRFPPALVRNWQVDVRRVQEMNESK